ncbi:MAG: N-6 DNA methylase, partial [Flavisolibacter sp.]|nr:N-6 DNA methylase [Flavisolibacter sp.]
MGYNSYQKLQDNIAAIRIALAWKEGQPLSSEDVLALKSYSGFGGLKAVLFPHAAKEEWIKLNASKEDLKLYPQIIELHKLLQEHLSASDYKQVVDALRNSILTAYYTPAIVPQTIFTILKEQNLEPKSLYEPSSGAGVFVTEAVTAFSELKTITAVEKDILSGRVLTALSSSLSIPVNIQIKGFEHTDDSENGTFDLIISNIPFGNFKVYDKNYPDETISGKIHNYFFAKGLDKIKEGGLLAFITTDAFLNSPSNKAAREYLFQHADYISLNVMPDNLMKDTGNTEAPSHLLIVQKNTTKRELSHHEKELLHTVELKNEYGEYTVNNYLFHHPELIIGNEIKAGKNQYGKAHEVVWQNGDINLIGKQLSATVEDGIKRRLNRQAFTSPIQN